MIQQQHHANSKDRVTKEGANHTEAPIAMTSGRHYTRVTEDEKYRAYVHIYIPIHTEPRRTRESSLKRQ